MKPLSMFTHNGPVRTFLCLLVGLSAVPYAFLLRDGSMDSPWALALMWTPGVAALVTRLLHRESLKAFGWRPRTVGWLLLAVFGPLVFHTGLALVSTVTGLLPAASDYLTLEAGRVSIAKTALLFGTGPQHPLFFVLNFLLSFAVGNALYVFIALGEELGWRGFLQDELAERLPLSTTYVVLGLIWGYWHAPGILLGHNFPNYPVFGALVLMPVMTILLAVIIGEAWRRTGSVWVAALLHGSFNLAATVPDNAIQAPFVDGLVYEVLFFSALALVAFWFWRTADRSTKGAPTRAPGECDRGLSPDTVFTRPY